MKTSRSLVQRIPSTTNTSTASRPREAVFVNRSETFHSAMRGGPMSSGPTGYIRAEDAEAEHIRDLADFWRQNSEIL